MSGAGGIYRLTSLLGCRACSTVWRWSESEPGGWERLFDFRGRAAYGGRVHAEFGPLEALAMSPESGDGWAWGRTTWVTHDGGHTWRPMQRAPGPHSGRGLQIVTARDVVWALRRAPVTARLWHQAAPDGRVESLSVPAGVMSLVMALDDGRVVLLSTSEDASRGHLLLGDGPPWKRVPLPPDCPPDYTARTVGAAVFWACGQRPHWTIRRWTPRAGWVEMGRIDGISAPRVHPLDHQRMLVQSRGSAPQLLANARFSPLAITLRAGEQLSSTTGDGESFWLSTLAGRDFRSTDGGRSWIVTTAR